MIMTGSLQQKLASPHTSGISAPFDERLKEVTRAMVKSFMDLKDVLTTPAQEYGVLTHFLVRALGRSEFQTLLDDTASQIDEVRLTVQHALFAPVEVCQVGGNKT